MALVARAYYELSLVLPAGDDFNVVVTYYNGGAEPPYGGVRSPEEAEDSSLTVDQAESLIESIRLWIERVVYIMHPAQSMPLEAVPDLNMKTEMWVDDNNFNLTIESETLDAEFTYDITGSNIVMKARDAFDLSWQGFLFYYETIKQYFQKIKELQGG